MIRNPLIGPASLVLLFAATVPARASEEVARPIGTWTRTTTVGKQAMQVKMEVKADTMRCTVEIFDPLAVTITVDADYILTRDGRLLGAVPLGRKKDKAADKNSAEDKLAEGIFVCRFKVERETLLLTEVAWVGEDASTIKELIAGKYDKAEGRAAAAKAKAGSTSDSPGQGLPGSGEAPPRRPSAACWRFGIGECKSAWILRTAERRLPA